MKKDEIIKELERLSLSKEYFWILGSASLVLRDLLDTASDIDIAVTEDGFKLLNELYTLEYLGVNNNCKWYKINENIECCVDTRTSEKVEKSKPFNLLDLKYYYNNFLKDSKRDKDKLKKSIVKEKLLEIQ